MKKKYLLAEFIIVFLILIVPPLLTGPVKSGVITIGAVFSWVIIIQFLTALALDFQKHIIKKTDKSCKDDVQTGKAERFKRTIKALYWWAISFGLLMLINALVNALSLIMPDSPVFFSRLGNGPSSVKEYFIMIPVFFCSAYYEEVFYRQFIAETLSELLPKKKILLLVSEAFTIIIFALSHRYLGLLGVFNALLSGIVLRFCCIKTGSVYTGTAAHFMYNITVMLFALFIQNA